jgi:hypothetical protein
MKIKMAGALAILMTLTIVPELPLANGVCRVMATTEGQLVFQCEPRHGLKVSNQVRLDTVPMMRAGS